MDFQIDPGLGLCLVSTRGQQLRFVQKCCTVGLRRGKEGTRLVLGVGAPNSVKVFRSRVWQASWGQETENWGELLGEKTGRRRIGSFARG